MALSALSDELMRAEGMMMQDQNDEALELLLRLAEDAEEYVDCNCQTTDELQYFAFPTLFDRLAWRTTLASLRTFMSRLIGCTETLQWLTYVLAITKTP